MAADTVDYTKGESPMTDLQFTAYVELRDKYEALLALRIEPPKSEEEPVNETLFRSYEQVRDKCEELGNELALLRKENAGLRLQLDMRKSAYGRYRL